MSDDDISLDEKRVYEARRGTTLAYVASGIGLVRVEVSDDQIGRFGLVQRGETRDIAVDTHEGKIAVAAVDDVHISADDEFDRGDGEEFEGTEFGSAVAVAFADGLVAANPDGTIARYDGSEWTTLGTVPTPVTSMDGDLVGTGDGVYRIEGAIEGAIEDDNLTDIGLDDVRDVAADGQFAATATGIHRRTADGWTREIDGKATAVASTGTRSTGVYESDLLERTPEGWISVGFPAINIVDIAVGDGNYTIRSDGTIAVDPPVAKDGHREWATRSLGLTDVAAIAVLDAAE